MLEPYLTRLIERENLSAEDAETAMGIIMSGEATDAQIAAYLTALRLKGETVDEILGSATAMRDAASAVPYSANGGALLDTCGTGGDSSHSFNISTAAAFVIAGAGQKVAKHGNRAASSRCGSADVLAGLGLNLDLTPGQVAICIDEVGIGFLFAPRFHPAMKYAIGPRKEIRFRTIFNILGPLTNPAGATHQLMGVFDPSLTERMAEVLQQLGVDAAMVVHGHGGMDELTTTGLNRVSQLDQGRVSTYELDPSDLGFKHSLNGDLKGGSPAENAARMPGLLKGEEDSGLLDVIILNAGAGLSLTSGNMELGIEMARESIASGAAHQKMSDLVVLSQRLSSEPV